MQGVVVLAVTTGLTLFFWRSGHSPEVVRSAAFFALVLGIGSLIVVNRRFSASLISALKRPNPALGAVLGVVAVILVATQFIAPIAHLFRFTRVASHDLALVAGVSLVVLIGLEQVKPLWARKLPG